jgi:hypothetical protein
MASLVPAAAAVPALKMHRTVAAVKQRPTGTLVLPHEKNRKSERLKGDQMPP